MSTQADTGISRRTWRVAVIVFLTVLLGGTGLSGAAALWSVHGTATAQVKTAFWINQGDSFPISMTATRWASGDSDGRFRGVELSWAPTEKLPPGVEVTYNVKGEGDDRFYVHNWIESGLPYQGTGTSQRIQVSRPYVIAERFQITITPSIDGVPGKPSVHTFSIDVFGTVWPR